MYIERIGLDGEFATSRTVTGDWILVSIQAVESGIVDPELLDEFELTAQIRI